MRGSHRRTVATVTTLMIVMGMTALAAPASGAPVPDHIVLSPDPATITAGGTQTYAAEGFDASNGDLGDVTLDTTFTIDPPPGSCLGSDCTSNAAGDYTVTGTDGAAIAMAVLHVQPGPLARIVIAPKIATINPGGTQPYTTQGFDSFDNPLGDETPSTTFTIVPMPPGSCSVADCRSAVAGDYTVTGSASGSISDSATLHVVINPPSIASFLPSRGKVRAAVVITGTDLIGTSAVKFNGTPAVVFTVNSGTKVTATVPMGATSGKISVTAPGGGAISSASFKVKPTISRFKKLSGRTGNRVVIRGSAFTGATQVTFNKRPAKFHVATYKRIIAIVPKRATSGRIRVKTPAGRAASTTAFRVKPRITQFAPTAGRVGSSVVITGTGFSKVWKVTINGKEAAFKVESCLTIIAKVPRAKTGPIRVRTAFGGAESSTSFRVI